MAEDMTSLGIAVRGGARRKALSFSLLIASILTGLTAGLIFRTNNHPTEAASANITVTDNDQTISVDQSTSITTITKTSTVTIKDTTATLGYTLSAKLSQNTMPSSTVTINPNTDMTTGSTISPCTIASPCALNTTTPTDILSTSTTTATTPAGDTMTWTVKITIPANTPLDNYIVDIEYFQQAVLPPPGPTDPGSTLGSMQELTNTNCPTARGTAFDARNGQLYYVRKIGTLCWMESNLRYSGAGDWENDWGWSDDRKDLPPFTTSGYFGGSPAAAFTGMGIADPGGPNDFTNTDAATGFRGYLYNWCAAMGGQSNACNNTSTSGFDTNISICPAGWRLPSGGQFTTLNNTVNSGSTTSDAGLRTNFLAVYSGYYNNALGSQGASGYLWSSTVSSTSYAHILSFNSTYVSPADNGNKNYGFAVRCVR